MPSSTSGHLYPHALRHPRPDPVEIPRYHSGTPKPSRYARQLAIRDWYANRPDYLKRPPANDNTP